MKTRGRDPMVVIRINWPIAAYILNNIHINARISALTKYNNILCVQQYNTYIYMNNFLCMPRRVDDKAKAAHGCGSVELLLQHIIYYS